MDRDDFGRMWDRIDDDLGFNDHNMSTTRQYSGQPHTYSGQRGAQEVYGLTFRTMQDAFVRAYCMTLGSEHPHNRVFADEAELGEDAALCINDMYKLHGTADPLALFQNFANEIERVMGVCPNVCGFEQ